MSNPPTPKEVEDRMAIAAAAQPKVEAAVPVSANAGDAASLEDMVRKVLAEARTAAKAPPQEPDWSKVTEIAALDPNSGIYIPVFEHEVPSYLDIRLAEPEYMAVWVNRDQRRVSEKQAEGYEFLRQEHIAKDFVCPLKFDSEGMYTYADVVCMRAHKRIILGKRRKIMEQSLNQLRDSQAKSRAKARLENDVIANDGPLDSAFNKGAMSFF